MKLDVCLAVALLLGLQSPDAPDPDTLTLDALSARIEAERDATPAAIFDALGKRCTAESLATLWRAERWVADYGARARLYRALRFFAKDPKLGREAAGWLEKRCFDPDSTTHIAAAWALRELGDTGAESAERVLRRCGHRWVGSIVLAVLVEPFAVRQKDGDLRLLLLHFVENYTCTPAEFVTALRRFDRPSDLRVIAEWIGDKDVSITRRLLAVEALASMPGRNAERVLIEAADGTSANIQVAAIEALMKREAEGCAGQFEKHTRHPERGVRSAALVARALVPIKAQAWTAKVHGLAADRSVEEREVAALALAGLARNSKDTDVTSAASAKLALLLEDPEQSVRSLAVEGVLSLRSATLVPPLFERLAAADDAEDEQLQQALELLTGVDHGRSTGRWRAWWQAEGSSEALPTLEIATERRKERMRRRNKAQRSSFYGMNAEEENVVFVLDSSGSMGAMNEWDETRFDIVKQELEGAIQRMKFGVSFNIIFFSTEVRPWRTSMAILDEATRTAAIEFVRAQRHVGGTAIFDALQKAFEDTDVEHIYLLSDGEPAGGTIDDPEVIVEEVQGWNKSRGVKIHCISAGYRNPLLVDLAELTGGKFREAD